MSVAFKNIIANYGSRLWSIIAVYAFTPLYIKLLGIESYGIVSFYAVVMGIITLADAGIASAIDREFAKNNSNEHKLGILFFFEKLYALICFSIIVVIFLFSKEIGEHWLDATIPVGDMINYIRLIGAGVGTQLMSSIYSGALMGMQKQVRFGAIQSFGSMVKHVGVLALLFLIRQDLYTFLVWQLFCNLALILVFRASVLRYFNKTYIPIKYNHKTIPPAIWKYLSGMFFISLLNALNMQADKLVTSKLFSLENFGFYALISLLAQAPLILATPVVLSVFPYLTQSISVHQKKRLFPVFKRFCFFINAVAISITFVFIFYGKSLFTFWTHGTFIVKPVLDQIGRSLSILTIGYLFIAFQQMYFYFLLAEGHTRYSKRQIFCQIILVVPLSVLFIKEWDMAGAAIAVLVVQFLGFIYLLFVVHKTFIKKHIYDLLFAAYFIPIIVSGLGCMMIYIVGSSWEKIPYLFIFLAVLSGVVSVILNIMAYNKLTKDKIDFKNLF